jgi:hypothetical protein
LGDYGLSIVLGFLFVVSWIGQTFVGWMKYQAEQIAHGSTPLLFGSSGYIWDWSEATLQNWQSEFLQLLTFVVLTSVFIHKGSHESKDTDEEIEKRLRSIERRLEEKL